MTENALTISTESALAFGRVTYDPEHPGLDFPLDMEYPEWEAIGYSLQEWQEVGPWAEADWLNHGEARYGETYAQAINVTGHRIQTLMNRKYVGSRIPKALRFRHLSLSTAAEVASMEPEEQAKWLTLVRDNEWTREELRAEIKRSKEKTIEGTSVLVDDLDDEQLDAAADAVAPSPLTRVWNLLDAATKQDAVQTVKSIILQAMNILDGLLVKEGN